jgi:hypothetical protein
MFNNNSNIHNNIDYNIDYNIIIYSNNYLRNLFIIWLISLFIENAIYIITSYIPIFLLLFLYPLS